MTDNKLKMARCIDWFLPRLAIACLGVLLVVQALLFADGTRQYISGIDRLEGEQLALETSSPTGDPEVNRTVLQPLLSRKGKKLYFHVLSADKAPHVDIRINGKPAGSFRDGPVEITVYDNDFIEIDANKWHKYAQYQISVADSSVVLPLDGTIFDSQGDVIPVGRVKLK